ncbi:hypothetical protein [Hankyongella ginsenosidimutans]|uniref:hypothetical protein n=1 Tax=Hankyongella ginsenosidimutans TaxID=1763828 RepID=UPI001CA3811C|nr:hypothetical protein [Hankyongella ginsenosidimutans]
MASKAACRLCERQGLAVRQLNAERQQFRLIVGTERKPIVARAVRIRHHGRLLEARRDRERRLSAGHDRAGLGRLRAGVEFGAERDDPGLAGLNGRADRAVPRLTQGQLLAVGAACDGHQWHAFLLDEGFESAQHLRVAGGIRHGGEELAGSGVSMRMRAQMLAHAGLELSGPM